ncbi:MAG: GNAT family N-acetyltransferase [Armatimonadetes bacterium]|nr:GNAT family N-acetyltransferase [Armatimonadota bacterium]MDW8122922.1 GNAT family N-acetyltransferase [Armatimonadota bacterium]
MQKETKGKSGISFIIRPAQREDLPSLVKVYRSAYQDLPQYAYTNVYEVRDYINWLYRGDPHGLLVAEKDGEIIGFVSVHGDWWDKRFQRRTAEVHELGVLKEYQGQGVGSALFHAALDYARALGCDFASLWVGEENWLARNWYRRLGFQEVGRGWGEWIRMVKKLSAD